MKAMTILFIDQLSFNSSSSHHNDSIIHPNIFHVVIILKLSKLPDPNRAMTLSSDADIGQLALVPNRAMTLSSDADIGQLPSGP